MFLVLCSGLMLVATFQQESKIPASGELIEAILAKDEVATLKLVKSLDLAELQLVDGVHGSPLMAASRSGQDEIVRHLLARGVDVNQLHSDGRTALHEAAGQGNVSTCKSLLQAGASPNAFSKKTTRTGIAIYGLSPLDCAVDSADVDVVNLLIDSGGDPFLTASAHGSCLFRIADHPTHSNRKASLLKVTKRLLELGCDPNEVIGSRTPLINAVWRIDPLAVEVYLDACADLDVNLLPDGAGLSALHSVVVLPGVHRDHEEKVARIVRLLLKHGADPRQKSKDGESALSARKDAAIQRILIDAIQQD